MMKKIFVIFLGMAFIAGCASQQRHTDGVKTTFQSSREWRPTIDNRADAVMVYGVGGNPSDKSRRGVPFEDRVKSWQDKGYVTHFMTGIAWGEYQDYEGPLYEQIESAYAFILRNIRKSAKVDGLIRKESYELPMRAAREMIVNAHCHRNFLDESCVQVALYDDQLEVTSPGGLCQGLTLEEALSGRSRQRNRAVAEVFNQMGLIEAWGNGLKSIRRNAREYGLPEPEFIEMPETFRVNLFRKILPKTTDTDIDKASAEHRQSVGEASVEHQQSIGGTSAEHRQSIGEASAEHRRNIGGASAEHRRRINRISKR